jgi:hypothetical protein
MIKEHRTVDHRRCDDGGVAMWQGQLERLLRENVSRQQHWRRLRTQATSRNQKRIADAYLDCLETQRIFLEAALCPPMQENLQRVR